MFWKSNTCPVNNEDKQWIEEALLWFESKLGKEFLLSRDTITPTKKYFGRTIKGDEESVQFCLQKLAGWMDIDSNNIRLIYYSEESIEFSEGMTSKFGDDALNSAGTYQEYNEGNYEISIELQQLEDPISLIATLAHELAHVKLLGEWNLKENDEFLTDLATVVWGFGIFNANSVIKSTSWQGLSHSGWSVGNQGYMTQQMFAYALALLSKYREEEPDWANFLNRDIGNYYKKSMKYLNENMDQVKFKK